MQNTHTHTHWTNDRKSIPRSTRSNFWEEVMLIFFKKWQQNLCSIQLSRKEVTLTWLVYIWALKHGSKKLSATGSLKMLIEDSEEGSIIQNCLEG